MSICEKLLGTLLVKTGISEKKYLHILLKHLGPFLYFLYGNDRDCMISNICDTVVHYNCFYMVFLLGELCIVITTG